MVRACSPTGFLRGAADAAARLPRLRTTFVLAALALIAACGEKSDPVLPKLSIDTDSANIEVTENFQFSARNARSDVSWSSSNPSVASVVSTGYVTAVAAGSTRIIARTATDSSSSLVVVRARRLIVVSATNILVSSVALTGADVAQDITISNGAAGTITGLKVSEIRYPEGSATQWLSAALSAPTATASQASLLKLTSAVAGLAPGTYAATVIISSDATTIVPASVNVTFIVADAPTIELSATTASFSATSGGSTPAPTLITVRSGSAAQTTGLTTRLTYNEAQVGWLTATLDSTSTSTALRLQASPGVRPAGTYTATVTVAAANPAIAARTIPVTFTVGGQPRIDPGISTVDFGATTGGANPSTQTVTIVNGGAGTLAGLASAITYGTGATGWLTATLNTTTAPATLSLSATTGALTTGTYAATVRVSATNASNTPTDVTVRFTVASVPTIVLSTATATFAAGAGGASPGASTVSVSSGNAATLSGLTTSIAYTTGAGWLTATLGTTTAPATITLQATTGALAAGTYTARVSVASPVAGNSPRVVDVTFNVSAGPVIAVSPTSLTFASSTTTTPAAQTVAVTNSGGGALTGLAAAVEYTGTGATGWLSASLSATTAPATLTVTAARGSLAAGTYTANVRLTSTVAGVAPTLVAVSYTIGQAPSIALSATSRSFAAVVGSADPAAQTVTVGNGGGGTLSGMSAVISYGAGSGWLSAVLNTTTAPATLTLTAARGALLTGTYTATVTVASAVATNSPQTVTVTMTVTAPAIALNQNTRAANIGQGNGATVVTPVSISNAGDGSLTGLTATVTYVSGPSTGWVTAATLNTTTAPATVTISVSAGSPATMRAVGTYVARVTIASPVASNTSQDVTVQMTVGLSLANSGVYAAVNAPTISGGGNCSGCHIAGSTVANVPDLSTAASFYSNLVGIGISNKTTVARAISLTSRIVAFNSEQSYTMWQIRGDAGTRTMTAGSAAQTLVQNWINGGALP